MPDIELQGCRTEPLMSYLKAIGILRILGEQSPDKNTRGFWRRNVFLINSDINEEDMVSFFLHDYEPTPLLNPWNGHSGFFHIPKLPSKGSKTPKNNIKEAQSDRKEREAADILEEVRGSDALRLNRYRQEIENVKTMLIQKSAKVKLSKTKPSGYLFKDDDQWFVLIIDKKELLRCFRSEIMGDHSLPWLDAAMLVLANQNPAYAPVLGTGGNVGNLDFSVVYMKCLLAILSAKQGEPIPKNSEGWLKGALFGIPTVDLLHRTGGQYDPGRVGGYNMGQGLSGDSLLNPWDFVLMCEGILTLSGAVKNSLSASTTAHAAFPFTVHSSRVGYGSVGGDKTKGEIWLPVWNRPTGIHELRYLFAEGRAENRGRSAYSGVDFARAVASLEVDRGIASFMRYEFQERLGQSYIATALGRFEVNYRKDIDLLNAVDKIGSIYQLRKICRREKNPAPPRFQNAIREFDSAQFDYCKYGGNRLIQVLMALGKIERTLSLNKGEVVFDTTILPFPNLSSDWISATYDGSVEYRIALALASIRAESGPEGKPLVGPFRSSLEPVEYLKSKWSWSPNVRSLTWSHVDLCKNLLEALQRRVLEWQRNKLGGAPLAGSFHVSLEDISHFVHGNTDDNRIEELLWGLSLVRIPYGLNLERDKSQNYLPLPRPYAAMKLLFLPPQLAIRSSVDDNPVQPERSILAHLSAGNIQKAYEISLRRLRFSGFVPIGPSLFNKPAFRVKVPANVNPIRLAATLVIPVTEIGALKQITFRPAKNRK